MQTFDCEIMTLDFRQLINTTNRIKDQFYSEQNLTIFRITVYAAKGREYEQNTKIFTVLYRKMRGCREIWNSRVAIYHRTLSYYALSSRYKAVTY